MQAPRHVQGLIQRAEDHCEDDIEGPMKPSDWISKRRRVIGNRGGHPGVRELEKQRPSRSEEYRCFAIYLSRLWTRDRIHLRQLRLRSRSQAVTSRLAIICCWDKGTMHHPEHAGRHPRECES